jgi:alkylation response protein AidB-like acyl-CoA dehydrogenase
MWKGDDPLHLELSPDQQLFVDTTRRFLQSESPVSELRALHERGNGFDRAQWQAGAALGWTAALVPEALGGGSVSGSGLRDLVLVAEEMGRVLCPVPLGPVNAVLDTLGRHGAARHEAVLAALVAGDAIATWALDEGHGTFDVADVALRAEPSDDGWTLTGTKAFVQEAAVADWMLVAARTSAGLSQFLVPRGARGVMVHPRASLDLVRQYADVAFDAVEVPHTALVGEVGGAAADIEHQRQVALVLQNAETVGALDTVFGFTLDYASDRVAFGRPIASYQALKHRFADLKTWLEGCHATATASTDAVADQTVDAPELLAVATAYIDHHAPRMVQDCIQLHGGIGVTWEHDLHLYLRRITQHAQLFGGVRHHRERLAALIGRAAPTG